MTRINSAIPVINLTDQHLLAEIRELPRIFTAVDKRIKKGKSFNDIPDNFKLETGHCRYFYNKLLFLKNRYSQLINEYKIRYEKEYNTHKNLFNEKDYKLNNLWNGYNPTEDEKKQLINRISTRITESEQKPFYYRREIKKEKAIQLLNIKNAVCGN